MSMKTKVVLVVVALSIGVFAAMFVFNRGLDPKANTHHDVTQSRPPSVAIAVAPSAPSLPNSGVPTPPLGGHTTPAREAIWKRFESASDLHAFVAQMDLATAKGDEKAYVAKALRACMEISSSSVAAVVRKFQDSLPKSGANNAVRLRNFIQSAERCRGFEGYPISKNEISRLSKEAEDQGSPLALSSSLFEIQKTRGRSEAVAVLEGVLSSQDPNAILGSLAFLQQPGLLAIGAPADPSTSQVLGGAIVLAICDLGLDCGPGGQYLTATCTTLNQCDVSSVEELIVRAIPHGDRELLTSFRALIRDAIQEQKWNRIGLRRSW